MHPWEERIPGDPLGYHIPPIVLSYWALLLTFTAGTDSDTCAKMRSQHLLAQQIDIDQVAFGQMEGKKKKKNPFSHKRSWKGFSERAEGINWLSHFLRKNIEQSLLKILE